MERLRNTIRAADGSMTIWGIFLVVFVIFIFMMFFEKYRLEIVVDEAAKDITTTLTSTASSNLYKSSFSVRDGTSGTYVFDAESFTEIEDTSKFTGMYASLYSGSTITDSTITKLQGGKKIFYISDIALFVNNATDDSTRSTYICEYDLTVYLDLLWGGKSVTLRRQKQISEYINKF